MLNLPYVCETLQEVNGLRNQYLDTFLPPRRKQQRHQEEQQEEERPKRKLHFLHYPITDLNIPTTDQCASTIYSLLCFSLPSKGSVGCRLKARWFSFRAIPG